MTRLLVQLPQLPVDGYDFYVHGWIDYDGLEFLKALDRDSMMA